MNNVLKDGPMLSAFENDTAGVIKQELTTYRVKNGMLVKEVVTRQFNNGDWHDTSSSQPLAEVKQ